MLNVTPIAKKILLPKALRLDKWIGKAMQLQTEQLMTNIVMACDTLYGREYHFRSIKSYPDFAERVPLNRYEDLKPYIMRMVKGESDVLWKGRVTDFAQSSGTSDGKSKFIPISREALAKNHIGGAYIALACYLRNFTNSKIFSGRSFILGGSFANTLDLPLPDNVHVGDLSATLISKVPRIIEMFYRVPSRTTALMSDWEDKLPALVEAASKQNVTNISGVPSWFMTVLQNILDYTKKDTILEVWPHLEVFFHGGINFNPYRDQYKELMGGDINYVETYNASEGFFAVQDNPQIQAMRLLIEQGVFYEFLESGSTIPVTVDGVETGKIYELIISSCNGLWRYSPGDTIRVESVEPLRISVVGRTKHFINAFGEEVMVYNADNALMQACRATGANVINYTAAPLYAHDREKGRHQWLIEFSRLPSSIMQFEEALDEALRRENSDYDAKRSHSLFLEAPQVVIAHSGVFDQWLASTGKLGGQRKVPKLSNNREIIEAILKLNDQHHETHIMGR